MGGIINMGYGLPPASRIPDIPKGLPLGIPNVIDNVSNNIAHDVLGLPEVIDISYITKVDQQDCYVRVQIIENKKIKIFNGFSLKKIKGTGEFQVNPIIRFTRKYVDPDFGDIQYFSRDYTIEEIETVIYEHIFFKSDDCIPKQYDDPKFEDDIVPDYPDNTPDIAVFLEVNTAASFIDYFGVFICDYAYSKKISFNDIQIISKDKIHFTIEIETNLKYTISLSHPEGFEGNYPDRNIPSLSDYIKSDKNQSVHKNIYTFQSTYDGQQNVYKKYKGKFISAFITSFYDSVTMSYAFYFIGHPLIVKKEVKKAFKQLSWESVTPYYSGVTDLHAGFLNQLDSYRVEYYHLPSQGNHGYNGVNRYNAIIRSIPLLLYYELEPDKKIKTNKKPVPPNKPKECDCMSCDDSLAKLILSRVNSLLTECAELKKECTALKKNIGDFPVEIEITDSDPTKPGNQSKKIKLESIAKYIKEEFNNSNNLAKILGVSRFPAKLPNRLIMPNGKDYQEIKDIPEYLGYLIKQIDKAIGFLPQKIKIADSDLAKPGNQPLEVEVHSLADFARETLKILLDNQPESDIHTNMLVRILYELGYIHQGAIQILANTDAMVEHLDFKHKFIVKEYPFAFNPYANNNSMARGFGQNKNDKELKEPAKLPDISNTEDVLEKLLSKLLQQCWIKVRTIENIEKRSLNQDIQSIRRDANTAALAVATKADPKILEELVNNALIKLETTDMIQQISSKKVMSSGDIRTKNSKINNKK